MPPADRKVITPGEFPTFANVRDTAATPGFNGVFFGPPGVGKTSLVSTMKEVDPDGKILLFDADVGRESVLDVDMDFASGFDWHELRAYLDTALALKDDSPYRTYAFDSLSSIYYELAFPVAEKKLGAGKDGRQYYFEAQKMMTRFVRDAKTLAEYGINTIFTGHVKEENDGDVTNIRLALPQGVRNEILLAVNHVGYLNRVKNTEVRELHFAPPRKVDGPKIRATASRRADVPLVIQDPTMKKILDAIKKGN